MSAMRKTNRKARCALKRHAVLLITCGIATNLRFSHAADFFKAMAQARVDNSADRTFRSSCPQSCSSSTTWGCTGSPPSHSLFTRYNTSPALVRWTTSLSGLWAEFPHGAVYVMTLVRIAAGINKVEEAGRRSKGSSRFALSL